jgi:hypothetical protein
MTLTECLKDLSRVSSHISLNALLSDRGKDGDRGEQQPTYPTVSGSVTARLR